VKIRNEAIEKRNEASKVPGTLFLWHKKNPGVSKPGAKWGEKWLLSG
jgi:hypothetical protein